VRDGRTYIMDIIMGSKQCVIEPPIREGLSIDVYMSDQWRL